MTPEAAALLRDRAAKQIDNGRCAVHVTADQLAELATCYICLYKQREQIGQAAGKALLAWARNHRDTERELLGEIVEACKCA